MLRFLSSFLFSSLLICAGCRTDEPQKPSEKVREYYFSRIAKSDSLAKRLLAAVSQNKSESNIQTLFKEARLAYKEAEFMAEYYSPQTAKAINGAPIPEIDVDDQHKISEPEGFQVLEPLLFPEYDSINTAAVLAEIRRLISNYKRLNYIGDTYTYEDDHIFDALRLEVFRIITLGISGFDAAIAQNSIPEARASILSILHVISIYETEILKEDPQLYQVTQKRFIRAGEYLSAYKDFNTFNRMEFIKEFANPLSSNLSQIARLLKIKPIGGLRALNSTAVTMFEAGAFNADYFAPNQEAHTSRQKENLGALLFFDPVLSGKGNRSCVSCHQPGKAFTDGLPKNFSISGDKLIKRNTPTVLNAGFQAGLFYDVRVSFLEDQATAVITNADEMHGSLEIAVSRLRQSPEYAKLFKTAFPKDNEPISDYNLRNSIASYIRSLSSMDARFDKYIRAEDNKSLTKNEINGFNIYMGKAKCGTCHFMPLFNGTVPPNFSKSETEIIGVPISSKINKIDSDPGRFNTRHIPLHKNAFRTPTIRNISLTAPYMHNGIYNSLEEVIDFYNEGGGTGLGLNLENQTLPFDNLKLTPQEKKDIASFMNTLTDNSKANDIPKILPALSKSTKPRLISKRY